MGFWLALSASRQPQIKKLHRTKSECFWVTFKSCFMQDPQIANFYLANMEAPQRCIETKSTRKQKVLRIWFFWGVPSKKYTHFHPPGQVGYPWGPWNASNWFFNETKGELRLILEGVTCMKNFEIPKFWSPPGQSRLPALFSWGVEQKSKFCSQHIYALFSHFQKGMT